MDISARRVATQYVRRALTAEAVGFSDTPMSKSTAIRRLYKLIGRTTTGIFHDNSWQPVHQFFRLLLGTGASYQLTKTEYGKDARGIPSSKTWWFTVDSLNPAGKGQRINGYIVAAGAGSVDDPLSRYDLTVVLN